MEHQPPPNSATDVSQMVELSTPQREKQNNRGTAQRPQAHGAMA